MIPKLKFLVPFSFLCAAPVFAETERQLDAHNHGEAMLNIVMDGKLMELTFISPSANLIGFEHKPKNQEQQAKVDSAKEMLADYTKLFGLPSQAACKPIKSAVHWTFDEGSGHEEHDEHEEHGDHDEHEEHDEHEGAVHSELEAEWRLACEKVDALNSIEVQLFKHFPALEKLHVEAIFADSPLAATLTSDDNLIKRPK